MLTIIAPHGRSEFSLNLIANFRRQRDTDARLLIVANGNVDSSNLDLPNVTVIRSGSHQSDAMNAGLFWLRANGAGSWARFDDDDYYSPNYIKSVESSLTGDGVIVSGMPWRFVMLDDGLHQFNGNGEFTGGTHACNTAYVPPFQRKFGEDLDWCASMRKSGAKMVQRDPWFYCYDRTTRLAKRAYVGGRFITRRAFGTSLFYGPHSITAVDYPGLQPICSMDIPSDQEIFTDMCRI